MELIGHFFLFIILILSGLFEFGSNFEFEDGPMKVIPVQNEHLRASDMRLNLLQQQLIPANYNILEPPPTLNGIPTRVNLSIIVMNIRGIDEKEEEITLEMNLRMFWRDSRLGVLSSKSADFTANNSFLVLSPKLINDIWHPDIFIDHAIEVTQPSLITPPASLRIYADSVIRYSARLTVKTACEMNFHLYPVDTQECAVQMMSYAYPSKVMELAWADKGAYMGHKLTLANFQVHLDQTKKQTMTTGSANYSNLQFTIILQRNISYHLIQTYLPSLIFLVISWVSYMIPAKNVGERISCCMVTLLSLTVMFGSLNSPKVSYFTGLHIWMITCVISVFVSFVEFVIVLKLRSMSGALEEDASLNSKKGKKDSKFAINHAFEMQEMSANGNGRGEGEESSTSRGANENREKYAHMAQSIEKVSAIALPSMFLIFNFVYWPWLFVTV